MTKINAYSLLTLFSLAVPALSQIHVFKDGGFGGDHALLPWTPQDDQFKCLTLGDGWERSMSSVIISGGLQCVFYAAGDCTPAAGQWAMVGENPVIPNDANDRISSYSCFTLQPFNRKHRRNSFLDAAARAL